MMSLAELCLVLLRALPLDKIEQIEALQLQEREMYRSGRRALTLDFAKACMPTLLTSNN